MIDALQVLLDGRRVGRLDVTAEKALVFSYDDRWIKEGFDLAPGRMPFDTLANKAMNVSVFGGLHGVFSDSLPDGWGMLLMDRALKNHLGLTPHQITPLDRLSYIGSRGMGALEYRPETLPEAGSDPVDLADLALQSDLLLHDKTEHVVEQLRIYGGSPGGARPKVTVALSADGRTCLSGFHPLPAGYSHWMVKFRGKDDPVDMGRIERAYAEMAARAGLEFPESRLIEVASRKAVDHYFAVKRFDRDGDHKHHCLSLSGYLYADHRLPCLDYARGVIAPAKRIAQSETEALKAFRLMVFNVLAHNKDDHAKNFVFLCDGKKWRLSPAFDLTFSGGMANEHTTSIAGAGNPCLSHIDKVAKDTGLRHWRPIVDEVRSAVQGWGQIASAYDVSGKATRSIWKAIGEIDRQVFGD